MNFNTPMVVSLCIDQWGTALATMRQSNKMQCVNILYEVAACKSKHCGQRRADKIEVLATTLIAYVNSVTQGS